MEQTLHTHISQIPESVEIDDSIILALEAANIAQGTAYQAFEKAVNEATLIKEQEKHKEQAFKNAKSRNDKHHLLLAGGWEETSLSVYKKDGEELKMHEAFNKLKIEVLGND